MRARCKEGFNRALRYDVVVYEEFELCSNETEGGWAGCDENSGAIIGGEKMKKGGWFPMAGKGAGLGRTALGKELHKVSGRTDAVAPHRCTSSRWYPVKLLVKYGIFFNVTGDPRGRCWCPHSTTGGERRWVDK